MYNSFILFPYFLLINVMITVQCSYWLYPSCWLSSLVGCSRCHCLLLRQSVVNLGQICKSFLRWQLHPWCGLHWKRQNQVRMHWKGHLLNHVA
jgi:hypothetical protein